MLWLNEFRFLVRQPLVWLSGVVLVLFSLLLAHGTGGEHTDPEKQLVYIHCAFIMLALPILMAALSPLLLMRDSRYGMTELVGVTALSTTRRLLLRYGALLALCTAFMVIAMSLMTLSLWHKSDVLLLGATGLHVLVLMLPAALLLSAISLWLAAKNYSAYTLYAAFGMLWIGYATLASMSGSPILAGSTVVSDTLVEVMCWVDPFGFTAYTQAILSGQAATLDPSTTVNRLIIVVFAAAIVYFSVRRQGHRQPRRQRRQPGDSNKAALPAQPSYYQLATTQLNASKTLLTLTKTATQSLLTNKLNLLLLLAWAVLIFSEVSANADYAEPFSIVAPTSLDALNRVMWELVAKLGAVFVLFWAWQLAWMNKRAHIHELIAASPVSTTIMITSQLLTLSVMLIALMLTTALGSSIAEWVIGSQWYPLTYIQHLSLAFASLWLLSAVFVAINHWCNYPLMAVMINTLVLVLKFTSLTAILGLAHPLWNIAATPLSKGDSFWGFAATIEAYLPFMGLWLIVISCLILLAIKQSHRGTGSRFKSPGVSPYPALSLFAIAAFTVVAAHFVLQAQNPFIGLDTSAQWRAEYEKRYKHWQEVAQPMVTHIDASVDFYPQASKAEIQLDMQLVNTTDIDIKRVLVGGFATQEYQQMQLEDAVLVDFDSSLNQYQFVFSQPMRKGENKRLKVKLSYTEPSLFAASLHQVIKPEFGYLRSVPILPVIGFNPHYRIRNNDKRQAHGVEPIPLQAPSQAYAQPDSNLDTYDWVSLHSVVSTTEAHFAIAQGKLQKSWRAAGRAYFVYESSKIRNIQGWLSTPMKPTSATFSNREYRVFSAAPPPVNQLHLEAMHTTASWFADNGMTHEFGDLNLISIPNIGPTGYALPGIILINNKVGFRALPSDDAGFDQRFRRTVHETTHQWLGHGIGNGAQYDRAFLVESMAKYVELVLLQQEYGEQAVSALVDYERQRFRLQRASNQLEPLSLVDARASFEMYSAASVVFQTLRKEVGDQPIIAALKTVWRQHHYPQRPATSMDFIRALKSQLGERWHNRIEQLFLSPLTMQSDFMHSD